MIALSDIQRDGAHARRHGYPISANPYRTSTHDGVRPHPRPAGYEEYGDAWDRGWKGPDVWDQADQVNAERAKQAELARAIAARAAGRDNQPMPAGSLFDEVTRAQQELF